MTFSNPIEALRQGIVTKIGTDSDIATFTSGGEKIFRNGQLESAWLSNWRCPVVAMSMEAWDPKQIAGGWQTQVDFRFMLGTNTQNQADISNLAMAVYKCVQTNAPTHFGVSSPIDFQWELSRITFADMAKDAGDRRPIQSAEFVLTVHLDG
jgi:hypothetical protein